MKYLIIPLLSLLILSCESTEKKTPSESHLGVCYFLESGAYVPDSLIDDYSLWVKNTLSAAHQGMGAGEYEYPTTMFHDVEERALEIYGVRDLGLKFGHCGYIGGWAFLPQNKFMPREKEIFEELKKQHRLTDK